MSARPISVWVARTQVKKLCQYKAKIFDKQNFPTKIISTKTNLCWKMGNVSINCFSSCASVAAGHLEITWSNKERDVAWCLMDFLHKKLAHFCGRRSLSVLIDIWRTWNRQFDEKSIFFRSRFDMSKYTTAYFVSTKPSRQNRVETMQLNFILKACAPPRPSSLTFRLQILLRNFF